MLERAHGKERLMPLDANGLLPQLRAVRFLPFRRRLLDRGSQRYGCSSTVLRHRMMSLPGSDGRHG
ncbi:MAG: hypothetical protein V7640_2092 [Betaproteobacteria bacterium]|jgi:hypothetical protein